MCDPSPIKALNWRTRLKKPFYG